MKKFLIILILVLGVLVVRAASVMYPQDGGTGTGTTPSTGDILVGQSDGTYSPQATSTLGIGGLANIIEDLTPQLGGDLDGQAFDITTTGTSTAGNFQGIGGGLTLDRISGSTFSTIQDMQNINHSVGWVSGGNVTNDGDGTITVAKGTGLVRATNFTTTTIFFTDWAAESGANVALTDNDISFIYIEYNGGSPRAIATTTELADFQTNILLATIAREGTTLHINTADKITIGDHASNMIRRLKQTLSYGRVSGAILSEVGTRNIAITAGSWWRGLTTFNTSALNTSTSDTFTYYWGDGSGGFNKATASTTIDNTQYDDGDGVLGTLSNNKYGVHWIYVEADDDDVAVLFGLGNYTLTQARDAQAPSSIPQVLQIEGILVGKIIIKESASTFTQLENVKVDFAGSLATDHGNLAGLSDIADHAYALLIDGTRALTGNWAIGGFDITGVGTLNVTTLNASTTVVDTITINSFVVGPLIISGTATSTITGDGSASTIGAALTVTGELTLTAGLAAGNLDAASVDGDDINSNIAGRSLTLTSASPDTLDADAELYTDTRGFGAANATSTNNGARQKTYNLAATIIEITCSTNGADITIGVDERGPTTPDSSGTDVITGGSMVCDSNGNTTTTFANAGISAGNIINVEVDSVVNSTTTLRFSITTTAND